MTRNVAGKRRRRRRRRKRTLNVARIFDQQNVKGTPKRRFTAEGKAINFHNGAKQPLKCILYII